MSDLLFGLDTFGDVPQDDDGELVSHAEAIRQVVDEAVLADQVGVDVIALGEHHRPEFSISTPETVLAAIAARTSRIQLGSGVTVLSSDDPVRVFQRFATLDALSERARRGHPRARLVHRVVPALRLRPARLRGAVRGEDRPVRQAAGREAGHLERHHARRAGGRRRVPQDRVRPPDHLGRRGRLAAVGRPHRALRAAAHARDHRRRARALRALHRPLPARRRAVRHHRAPGRHALARLHRRHRRGGQGDLLAAATRRSGTGSARCAAGRRSAARSSTPRSSTAPSTSAPRRPSPARWPVPSAPSASAASTSSTPPAALPASARLRAVELYGTKVDPHGPRAARRAARRGEARR